MSFSPLKETIKLFNAYNAASQGCLKKSRWWLNLMVVVNFFIPLALIFYVEAQVTVLCALAGLTIGLVIFKFDGYRRLLALMHLPWVFLVLFIWGRLPFHPSWDFLSVWMHGLIAVNSICLAIDAKDLVLYFCGNREYPAN